MSTSNEAQKPDFTLAQGNDRRLQEWREQREEVADKGREARLKLAEEDRKRRLEQFEKDKAQRIEDAERKRADALASAEQARIEAAQSRLSSLEDLETARRRLIRQRRRANLGLGLRFCLMVVAPAIAAAWFYLQVAQPLYASRSIFAVRTVGGQPLDTRASSGPFQSGAGSTDSFVVRAYLTSPDLISRLEADHGFSAAFNETQFGPLGWLQSLVGAPLSLSERHERLVQVGLDTQEDLIDLTVSGTTPAEAEAMAEVMLRYAQDHLNSLASAQHRRQLSDLAAEVVRAAGALTDARKTLVDLQISTGEFDPAAQAAVIYRLMSDLEAQRSALKREIDTLRARTGDNSAVIAHKQTQLSLLDDSITDQKARLVSTGTSADGGVNTQLAQFEYARIDIEQARQDWDTKVKALEALRLQIAASERVLALVSKPSRPVEAAYPKPVEGTVVTALVAFAVFCLVSIFGASILTQSRR